jgi:VWFA-related protein
MRKLLLASALLLALPAPSPAAQRPAPAAPSPPVAPGFGETMEVNVVNVDVYVTDKQGQRVTGLKKEDFEVYEDGKPIQVTNFEASEASERRAPAPEPAVAAAAPSSPASAPSPVAAPDPENRLSLVIFLDDLHLRPEHRARAVEQIRSFLARGARPGDRVLLATNGVDLRTRLPFTEDRAALDAALREAESLPTFGVQGDQGRRTAYTTMMNLFQVWGCSQEMIRPVEAYAQQAQADALRTVGALKLTINSLAGIPGRKALLYVSDGLSISPGEELFEAAASVCTGKAQALLGIPLTAERQALGSGAGTAYDPQQAALDAQKYSVAGRVSDLTAHANANRVTFYALQASGLQGTASADASFDTTERLLQTHDIQQIQTTNLRGSLTALASDTGGRAILDANDLGPELARMQEDFATYYSLGYTPAHRGDGRMHKVEVKAKRPGLRIRYRQSYRDKPTLEKVFDRTLAALYHGVEDNPLEITVEVGEQAPAADGQYSVPFHLRIPLFKLAILNQNDNLYQGKLRVLVAIRDEAGGASPMRQLEVPLSIQRKDVLNAMGQYYVYNLTLNMKPGVQHVAVAVRDDVGATTSYLSRTVTAGNVASAAPPTKP